MDLDSWDTFCKGGADNTYFYGYGPVIGTCVDRQRSSGGALPVRSAAGCHGTGFAATVHDMAGNVGECGSGAGSARRAPATNVSTVAPTWA